MLHNRIRTILDVGCFRSFKSLHLAFTACFAIGLGAGAGVSPDDSSSLKVKPLLGSSDSVRISGPWGIVEIEKTELVPSLNSIQVADVIPEPASWFFAESDRDTAASFLESAGLNAAQSRMVQRADRWKAEAKGQTFLSDREFLLGLTPDARRTIYRRLALDERNPSQRFPYTFASDQMESLLQKSGLRESTTEAIRKLLYAKGQSSCLADVHEVFGMCADDLEKQRFIRMLSRHPGVQLRVRLDSGSDLETAVAYWGKGVPEPTVRSLLESLWEADNRASMDVVFFLPPLARNLLHTYPGGDSLVRPNASYWNCSWTALNFFAQRPDPRYVDLTLAEEALQQECRLVKADRAFGDVLVWRDELGKPLHMAVYVAGDVVFTKNGFDAQHPWTLMSMEQMAIRFPSDGIPKIEAYRKRSS
ncbi:MAG: hypothetical protein ACI9VS_000794 [Candidatus Binatia bacterium]|jgi:hypothetical protein